MTIRKITRGKKRLMKLLLLADEQEQMIDRYLERGDVYALFDHGLKTVCVVTDEGGGVFEIKNLATDPAHQGKGYGGAMIRHVLSAYRGRGHTMLVGTGDSPLALPFYEKRGFAYSHRVPNFFTDNYDHPMIEGGVLLTDMVYLKQSLPPE